MPRVRLDLASTVFVQDCPRSFVSSPMGAKFIRRFFHAAAVLITAASTINPVGLSVRAADAPAPSWAVDGINEKLDAAFGAIDRLTLYEARGALSVPIVGQWGTQVDVSGGSLGGDGFISVADHLFWRDPKIGLLGIYGNYTNWDRFGGVHLGQVAAEGELYWSRWTIQGIAGAETGNSVSTTTMPSAGLVTTTSFDVRTRFMDQVNLKYYLMDNWDGYIGHRYLGGDNALALGTEAALNLGRGVMASAFVEGLFGRATTSGVFGGLRFYFGQKDKTLIARQRQDDPQIWNSLPSIVNSQTAVVNSQSAAAASSSGGGGSGSQAAGGVGFGLPPQ